VARERGRRPSGAAAETVLVTGVAGFIGSHLAARLRAEGHPVVGVDAFRGLTTRAAASTRLAGLADDPGFDLVELDLVTGGLGRLVERVRPAGIFHLAARPGARDADAEALRRDNVETTRAVLGAAAAAGADLVLASSSSVYGDAGARGASREDDPVAPLSAYGESKRAAELLCLQAPVRSRIVRLFTVYGPGQRDDMAFQRFIACALDGTSAPLYQRPDAARDFTYVADAVEGLVLARARGRAPVYNVSGGEVVSLATASRVIEELTGGALATHRVEAPAQPSATRADLSLARADLGYEPRFDLGAGLAEQVAAAVAQARVS
jgi:nucleoside-diphosphate-sugar epimerase